MRIIQYALDIGEGQGPVGHFFPLLKSEVSPQGSIPNLQIYR
ncbi:hypothetical protein [Microcoleus anatoxicus]|uniref:Uncharacterized protein n=1 Tax=Microcoleus anatoxicus PTRS2 TaxID=2705321 RepID=A0ABU8YPI4_9CYAN